MKIGLGTDIAGGYSADIMSAMRQAVITSRMRQGRRITESGSQSEDENLAIDWVESLFLATKGGATAMDLSPQVGTFEVGAAFDAQRSESLSIIPNCSKRSPLLGNSSNQGFR